MKTNMEISKYGNMNPGEHMDFILILVPLNTIITQPKTTQDFAGWSECIKRLRPSITPQILSLIVCKFLSGGFTYDKTEAIQNIFRGYDILVNEQMKYN
jgi:hypothetical protein